MIRVRWTFTKGEGKDGEKDFPANASVHNIVEHLSSLWEDGRCDMKHLHVRID